MSAPNSSHATSVDIERWNGGRNVVIGGGAAGVILTAISLVGCLLGDSPRPALYSYLVAFTYWCGISVASLIMLMIMHTFKARWVTVIRRPIEAMAGSLPVFVLLAIPVIAGMKHIYLWVDPPDSLGKEALHLIHHKKAYLNTTFFVVRLAIYFAMWILLGLRMHSLSKKQDTAAAPEAVDLLQKLRNISPVSLPFMALTLSFAAFDWLMSLNPTWFSTIYGVYYFGGSFVAAFSILALSIRAAGSDKNLFGAYANDEHVHNVGKLMLAFTCFWAYIGFSQFMLIWVAGLPEEVPFYITRLNRGWAPVGILLIFGHFFLPFGALLSRSLKRDVRKLALVAAWILFIHWVDIFWLVMPSLTPDGFSLRIWDFTAFAGVGLIAVAFGVSRLRGRYAVPIKDPYLADSLRYRQPT